MLLVRRARMVLAVLVLGVAPVGAVTVAASPACAASPHHAALIVDTGSGSPHRYCVGFDGSSISGKDVLDDAGMNPPPVYEQYGANGVAVCELLGVGRDSGHCLEAGNNWAYYRAAAGVTTFSYSNAGASSTVVHDGDVEGWIWEANPGPPQFTPESQICPAAAAPSTTLPAGGVVSRGATTTPTSLPPAGAVSTTAAPSAPGATTPASSTSTSASTTSTAPERGLQVAARKSSGEGSGSATSLIVFAAMLAGLIGWLLWVRRQRRRRPILPG